MADTIRETGINANYEDINYKVEEFVREHLDQRGWKIVNFVETKPLPPGENYSSLIIKLVMSVRKNGKDKKEALALIAKTGLTSETSFIDWSKSFQKESFVYTDLIPTYREIEREAGIEDKELIDILPEYFGIDGNIERATGENAVLLMKNLKFYNFYTIHINAGMNMDHSEMSVSLLARFHALGIAMRQKRPLMAARAVKHAKLKSIREFIFDDTLVGICETFQNNERLAKYEEVLKSSLKSYKKILYSETYVPEEPWLTITHGDFWTNNILFHRMPTETGGPDLVKFIDFQMYVYGSPLMDLPYFICTSVREYVVENKVEELLDTYYNNFIYTLKSVNCDAGPYTRHSFNFELKKQAKVVFALCAIVTKFFAFDIGKVKNHEDFQESIAKSENTDAFVDGLINLVRIYEKQNWF